MINHDFLSLLKSGYSLPPLSPVAAKLVELAADDNCGSTGTGVVSFHDFSNYSQYFSN